MLANNAFVKWLSGNGVAGAMPLCEPQSHPGSQTCWIILAALVLCALNIGAHFPGTLNADSIEQYRQVLAGRLADWHPPVMAFVWSLMPRVWGGPQPELILQVFLHWSGFALLADGLARSGRPGAGWCMIAAGAFPVFWVFNGIILKDVGLASTWITAFGLIFWFRVQDRRPPVAALAAALALIAYGTLVRKNAVFGFPPLLLYAFVDFSRVGARALVVSTCLLAAIAVPASSFFNLEVLGAAPSRSADNLLLFDLDGVARHAEENSVLLPKGLGSQEEYARCYTPYWADSIQPYGNCGFVWERFERPPVALWLDAVTSHPAAYLAHRLKHFNSEILFFVPAKHSRFVPDAVINDRDATRSTIALDYIRKNPLIWPVTWISLGLCALALSWRASASAAAAAGASRALLTSGLFYAFAYLVVGVGTDVRYHYWSIMAVLTAIIIGYPVLADRLRRGGPARLICAMAVGSVIALGLYARLTDNRALIF